MDGIVGMDSDGPAAGRVRKIGLILAGADAVSVDAVFSRIAGLPYSRNVLLRRLVERGSGRGRLDEIEVVGESLDSAVIKDFRLPRTEIAYRFPSFIGSRLAKLIDFRPCIDEVLCRKCDVCKAACPVDAITIDKNISRIDEMKCIKCFCCHEVCPHDAIYIKKNFLAKLIWR
jgi:ferredoxin